MPWNDMTYLTAGTVSSAADMNSNLENIQTTYNALPMPADGRLTLVYQTPVPSVDTTNATTLYYAPMRAGSLIALYDGSALWEFLPVVDLSYNISAGIKGLVYDIFIARDTGTGTGMVMSALAWKKVTATSSPTAGANKTINMSDTGDLAVGREVTLVGGGLTEIAVVTAVVNNTSITVANLVNSYTLPEIYGFNQRATALTTVNGVLVLTGTTTKRYIGTVRITGTTGELEDSTARRYVYNYYNRVERVMKAVDTTNSWSYTLATWRAANNSIVDGVGRFAFVAGAAEDTLHVHVYSVVQGGSSAVSFASGVGINKTDTNSAQLCGSYWGGTGNPVSSSALYKGQCGLGYSYVQRLEISTAAGTTTWYGDNGVTFVQTGMLGTLLM